ncbi:MAG: hypothetical protein AB1540_02455 [Bdellovibrionota bacterium]
MKGLSLVLFLALASTASANAKEDLRCVENAKKAQSKGRQQYAVTLKELKEIEDRRIKGDHDRAAWVRVSILVKSPADSEYKLERKPFRAVARSSDVFYNINEWRKRGFNMTVYLDELDQTVVKIKGVKKSIRMTCEGRI